MYEGEWLNNVRHGNGKFTNSEYEYLGQWHSDMKHGQGKYIKIGSDEAPIFGAFANDKLDGMATKGSETILYKEGMEIDLSGKDVNCARVYKGFCGALAFCFIYGIPFMYLTYGQFDRELKDA